MDPRQFVKNSNIQIQRTNPGQIAAPVRLLPGSNSRTQSSVFSELRTGSLKPGIYNILVNKDFSQESRVDLLYILKRKPKGHASIAPGLSIDLNEIKGIYGRFQTGAIHTSNFGMRGDLDKNFFSVQLSGYMTDGMNKKNFSFNIYRNGKLRFSGGFLGSKNLKKQPEALRKYLIDTYTQKQGFLYNDIKYNNIGGQFSTNANFDLNRIAQENPLKSFISYEPERSPFLYVEYNEYNYILSSKSGQLGAGIVQIQGENNPDNLENAYVFGVEMIKKLHEMGYTMGLVNKNVNASIPLIKKKSKIGVSTCPKPRRPPCKEGYETRKNPQGYECCFKIPKRKPVKKKTNSKTKNMKITYDKDGIMKIGGRKCERLTKPVLLDVAKKLGVVGVKNRNKKEDICKALDKLEKGNSDYKINDKLCKDMKKEQLITIAISRGISIDDKDTVKILCQKLKNRPNTPNSPNALANEIEKEMLNKMKRNKRAPVNLKRKLNKTGIKNDLIKLYGKYWMKKYGNVMNINENVNEVKKELNRMELKKNLVSKNGVLRKGEANKVKKDMVYRFKIDKKQYFKRLLLEKEANKLYGKFGKNTVNKVVNYAISLPKTPSLNSNKVVNFIKMRRELNGAPVVKLNKKRPTPPRPKPKVVKSTKKIIKRPPIKKKVTPPKNKVVKRLNFNSNSNSNSNSKSKTNQKKLKNLYNNFNKFTLKNKGKK